jgi:Golgi phosphoprotein 3
LDKSVELLFFVFGLGETWNVMKIGYQLKQVRERLAKGLVDKGILRTEKRNFLLFDMATHPIADAAVKDEIIKRVCTTLVSRATPGSLDSQTGLRNGYLRTVAMICSAYAANVLENSLFALSYDMREKAFAKVDEYLADFSTWPFNGTAGKANIASGTELSMEVVAAVLNVFTKMDSIVSVNNPSNSDQCLTALFRGKRWQIIHCLYRDTNRINSFSSSYFI